MESGGLMYMSQKQYDLALDAFFESFKSLVEYGAPNAKTMLIYVVLAQILANSEVDFLGTKEATIYKDDPSIVAMTNLKIGIEKNEIQAIMEVLSNREVNLLGDPFFVLYKDAMLRNVYLKALEALCRPYKKVKLVYLQQELGVSEVEIRELLSELILEERIVGQID